MVLSPRPPIIRETNTIFACPTLSAAIGLGILALAGIVFPTLLVSRPKPATSSLGRLLVHLPEEAGLTSGLGGGMELRRSVPTPAVAKEPSDPLPLASATVSRTPPADVVPTGGDILKEHQLARWLRDQVPELDLDAVEGTTARLRALAKEAHERARQPGQMSYSFRDRVRHSPGPVEKLVAWRLDLRGLPVLDEEWGPQTSPQVSPYQQQLSRTLRSLTIRTAPSTASGSSEGDSLNRDTELLKYLEHWKPGNPEAVPILVQELQVEAPAVRRRLVQLLAQTPGPAASAALAQRALFDLSDVVRKAAVQSLLTRPAAEWRPSLVQGFRHPWPVVADHAAEALVELGDQGAVLNLIAELCQSDPTRPIRIDAQKWVVSELVRVNHLRNCQLCHPSSFDLAQDKLRGRIPVRGEPLVTELYDNGRGEFIRGEVIYLRQDFSVVQPVAEPNGWPKLQRYDYVIRRRELTDKEADARSSSCAAVVLGAAAAACRPSERRSFPQREAILFALRRLTAPDGERTRTGGRRPGSATTGFWW